MKASELKILIVVGAALMMTPPMMGCMPSMKVSYGPTLGEAGKPTSNQKRFTIVSDFDKKDTMHAVKKALGMNGIGPEVSTAAMIAGGHDFEPGPGTRCQCTYAFYFKSSGTRGTEIVMLIDDHSWIRSGGGPKLATQLIGTINTVLASYE